MSMSSLVPLATVGAVTAASYAKGTWHAGKSFLDNLISAEPPCAPKRQPSVSDLADPSPQAFQDAVESLQRILQTRLLARGIDTTRSFELSCDDRGQIMIDGDHPQRAEIEDLFRNDPALTDAATRILSGAAQFRTASTAGSTLSQTADLRDISLVIQGPNVSVSQR